MKRNYGNCLKKSLAFISKALNETDIALFKFKIDLKGTNHITKAAYLFHIELKILF